MTDRTRIPRPTVKRLSLYLRELDRLAAGEQVTTSSQELGLCLGLTDAQVRKDLGYFGQFGHPGVGYRVAELIEHLRGILGTDRCWNTVVVGVGNIGRALMAYGRFGKAGFEIVGGFDTHAALIGTDVDGRPVHDVVDLPTVVREHEVRIGILAVPAEAAPRVAEQMIAAGIRGILNFAPVRLDVQDRASVVSAHLSVALEQLAFMVSLGASEDPTPDQPLT